MEEIAHLDPGAGQTAARKGGRFRTFNAARLDKQLCRVFARRARCQCHPADRANRWQCFAAKPHCVNVEKINPPVFAGAELGGCVPFQRKAHILAAHSATIIFNDQPFQTAALD